MIEALLAVAIFGLAALGLGLGLAFGRGPARTSCGAAACLPNSRCPGCSARRRAANGETRP